LNYSGRGSGTALFVLGIIGTVLFSIPSLVLLIIAIVLTVTAGAVPVGVSVAFFILLACEITSIVGIVKGSGRKNLIGRMSKYIALFDPKTVLSIDEITAETGIEQKQVRKDLRDALRKELHFDVRCDFEHDYIIRGEANWRQYLGAKEQRRRIEIEELESAKRMEDPDLAPIEAFRREGSEMITRIKAANIALPDEKISLKLTKLEGTLGQIIRHIDQYPEKLPETRKLMSYHLPATLKIVEKYREYETLEFKTGSVIEAQNEIEHMLDMVDEAFKKYLEKLMEFDTLDVTTDIEVLKQMFEKDGLTGTGLSS
jgi:hypothetical protein